MIVVRINDRGPYGNDRVISLLARQLTVLTRQTTPKFVSIRYCRPGWFAFWSWYGLYHSRQQTYALPAPPDLSGGAGTSSCLARRVTFFRSVIRR